MRSIATTTGSTVTSNLKQALSFEHQVVNVDNLWLEGGKEVRQRGG